MLRSDVIYIRYSAREVPSTLLSLLLATVKRVYWEHNTILEYELFSTGNSKDIRRVQRVLSLSRHFNVKHIAVTQELKVHLQTHYLQEHQLLYIQNGYSDKKTNPDKVNSDIVHKVRQMKKEFKRLAVFVGSGKYNWHGVPELLKLAQHYSDLGLIIIGDSDEQEIPSNVYLAGPQSVDTIHKVYEDCDFAFGSFNLAAKQMKEACPLKVREYLWSGLPVIVNYLDSARDFDCLKPYIININERPDGVAECMRESMDKSSIREHARSCLSWDSLLNAL